jgi:hypothetical protein
MRFPHPIHNLARHTAALLVAASLLTACSKSADAPVAPTEIAKDTYCALDGMLLADYPGPKAQIHYDGTPAPDFFCDTMEMFSLLLKPEQARKVAAAYVQAMDQTDWNQPKGAWIDAKKPSTWWAPRSAAPWARPFPPSPPAKAPRPSPTRKAARCIPLPKSPTWPASTAAPCTTRECEHGPVLQRHLPDDAIEIEQLARLMYDLRSARDKLLVQLGASDAADVLKRITSGELPEHPATNTTFR